MHSLFRVIPPFLLPLLLISPHPAPASISWERTVLNAESNFEATGVADLNNDGLPDIICGDTWYQGPDFQTRHHIIDIPEDGGYRIDFANVPMDINGDGWTDLVSCNWHRRSVVWRRNPGAGGGVWTEHLVDEPGNMETAVTADVDGDGRMDFLPDVAQKTIWYRHEDGALRGYEVSPDKGGHGIGFGDINGDGRGDILKPAGWFEAPADRLSGEWIWHGGWDAGINLGAAGIEVVAHDFTGDGRTDIWWGMGHDYGRFWMEQTADPAAPWIRHEVDMDWSQAHAVVLTDLDADGEKDILTGKRRYAHNGHDPGAEDPQILCWYTWNAAGKKFDRHVIREGGPDGLGLAPVVIDIDGDGDLDFVAPGKSGLFLYRQKRAQVALSPAESLATMHVPEGFEITLFASEPEIRKPISITFDERGRMVICEAGMYPLGPPPGEAPSDAVKILEDTDGDGRADVVKTFADGLNIPDAVAVGHGGIYVAEAPNLWHMRDTDGDDRADEKRAILTNFGTQDSHHNVHGLIWGPAGRLMMSQGCSTTSRITADGREWDLREGDFFRAWPDGSGFEIIFKGFTNSWGYDWDDYGNWVGNDNEGPHLIHLIEGADYGFSLTNRHDGKPGTLPGMERSYGDKRGYLVQSGLVFLSGDEFPDEWQGNVIQGAPKLNRVIRDSLSEEGASFVAWLEDDIVKSDDPWFRPIAMTVGPDGAIYIADWYNPIIAHVEHPLDSPQRDKSRGRIYRIAWKDAPSVRVNGKYPDLREADTARLVENLRSNNKWMRRTSQRLLAAKGSEAVRAVLPILDGEGARETSRTKCHALWTIEESRVWREGERRAEIDAAVLSAARDASPYVRAAAIRTARHIGTAGDEFADLLFASVSDVNDSVRLEATLALANLPGSALALDRVAGLIGSADWEDPYLAWGFGRAIEPYREPLLNEAFTLGARGLNAEGAALLPALGRLADPATEPLLVAMLRMDDLRSDLIEPLLSALESFRSDRVFAALVAYLAAHPNLPAPRVRGVLAELRGRESGGASAAQVSAVLSSLAEGRNDALLADVFHTAAALGDQAVAPSLLRALDHPDARVREAAMLSAGMLKLRRAEPAITSRVFARDSRERWAAIRAMADLGATPAEAAPYLAALSNPDSAADAVRVLRRSDPKAATVLPRVMDRFAGGEVALSSKVARELSAWIEASGASAPDKSRYRDQLTGREGVLRRWKIIGPFPNSEGSGHHDAYPPEAGFNPDAEYEYFGKKLRWKDFEARDARGVVGLMHLTPSDYVVAYGRATLHSEVAQRATLYCGSDDSIKVWVNGELVHDNFVDRGMTFDQDQAEIELRAGENEILVKCGQNAGGWNFHARIETLPTQVAAAPEDRMTRALHMPGDAARGETVFFGRVGCARCHAVDGRGGRVGPDLSRVGRLNPRSHIAGSILDPDAEIADGFAAVTIETKDGERFDGYIHRENADETLLIDAAGKTLAIRTDRIADRISRAASGMPSDLAEALTGQELADLVAWLEERG